MVILIDFLNILRLWKMRSMEIRENNDQIEFFYPNENTEYYFQAFAKRINSEKRKNGCKKKGCKSSVEGTDVNQIS